MATEKTIICPLMKGTCIEDGAVVDGALHACRFWVTVLGKDPQTGADISGGDCAIAWLPVLFIENSKINRETGAAIESMRNESVTTGALLTNSIKQAIEAKALKGG